jgi:hypothetical protein
LSPYSKFWQSCPVAKAPLCHCQWVHLVDAVLRTSIGRSCIDGIVSLRLKSALLSSEWEKEMPTSCATRVQGFVWYQTSLIMERGFDDWKFGR